MKSYGMILTIAVLALGSCADEPDTPVPGGKDRSVCFSISMPAAGGTRAMSVEDENIIETIDVLAFYEDGNGVYRYAYTVSDIRRTDLAVTATVKGYSEPQRFVVLVNASEELSAADIVHNEPLASAMRKIVCAKGADGQWKARVNQETDFDPIPMYAQTNPVKVNADNKQIGSFPLIRMVARIDVRVGGGVSDFVLTDARLYNQKTAGYVAYDFSGFSGDRVYKAAVPAANTNTGDPILPGTVVHSAVNGVIQRSVYAYESPAYGEEGRLTGTALIVGGKYNGQQGYYRVNLKTTDDDVQGRLSSHILRNHLYQVDIQGVSEAGYETPGEAYTGTNRLTATVARWSLVTQSVTDEQWWLSVDKDDLLFAYGESGDDVKLRTNYGIWSQRFPAGLWIDPLATDYVSGDPGWLTVTNVTGANGDQSRIIRVEADENTTASPRTAVIYVDAGNLSKSIHVKQLHKAPDWEHTSNCYMVKPGDPTPLEFPVSQVIRAMGSKEIPDNGFLGTKWVANPGNLKVMVLWSDVAGAASVVKSVTYNAGAVFAGGTITVVPGPSEGNAVIALYEDNNGTAGYQRNTTDKIIWSWHIWNTSYHPYDAAGQPDGRITSSNASLKNGLWMDRNLGAMSNIPGNPKEFGLYYQWGRKDPFTQKIAGILYVAVSGINTTASAPAGPNLLISVSNPVTYYTNSSGIYDWYTTNTNYRNDNLWGGNAETDFLHPIVKGHRKSVYDPCPEGYRLTRNGEWVNDGSWNSSTYGRTSNNHGGHYPYGERLRPGTWVLESGQDSFAYYWSATPSSAYAGRGYVLNFASTTSNMTLSGSDFRAQGMPIRCHVQ